MKMFEFILMRLLKQKKYYNPFCFPLLMFLFLNCFNTSAQNVFKMPELTGTTLNNEKIDSNYFKGHITFVSFFYIGCAPCMKEIPVLNKLNDHFKNTRFQILAIAPHSPDQLKIFNGIDSLSGKAISIRYRTEPIRYPILPECPNDGNAGMNPKCHVLSNKFGVNSYPTSVIINEKNEILMTTEGFPMRQNDEETLLEMIKMVEGYLK